MIKKFLFIFSIVIGIILISKTQSTEKFINYSDLEKFTYYNHPDCVQNKTCHIPENNINLAAVKGILKPNSDSKFDCNKSINSDILLNCSTNGNCEKKHNSSCFMNWNPIVHSNQIHHTYEGFDAKIVKPLRIINGQEICPQGYMPNNKGECVQFCTHCKTGICANGICSSI